VTYFTPEQEAAMYRHANPAFALALRVLIRTGARPGCEFAALTAHHVEETARGQIWRFAESESKTHRQRVIYVPEEIAELVRECTKKHPTGSLFRNTRGTRWSEDSLIQTLQRLKRKLQREGIQLDEAACPYTCRHTYAKRTLGGYWTGRPCTIEQLCGLMGNSREVCWDHYAQWCNAYVDPLWDAVEPRVSPPHPPTMPN
jgi:integrase